MAAPFYMPACGERAAPTFDTSKPRELIRFFEELEYLFMRASLEEESEKKKHVLSYVEFDVKQIWKTFPEYSDPTKTYTASRMLFWCTTHMPQETMCIHCATWIF